MVAFRHLSSFSLKMMLCALLFALSAFSSAHTEEKPITIGFIYIGPRDDYGYNQAHSEGAAVVKNLPGVTVREEEKVPETNAVQKTMESMVQQDGASLIFPT